MNLKLGIKDITKSYGKHQLLKGCTYGFGKGVTAIIGPNGCGKSSLLRICAYLDTPTSGRVAYFYTKDKAQTPDINLMRKITLVLPKGGIFDASTWSNVMFGLRVRRVSWIERKRRAREALEAVGLYEKRKQNALGLSSGESQRLALARALALEPQVLLLDEPTASVDDENTAIIERLILQLKDRNDAPTIVMTTHDRGQAERLADKIITIKQGKIATAGSVSMYESRREEEQTLSPEDDISGGGFFVDKKFFGGGVNLKDIDKIGD